MSRLLRQMALRNDLKLPLDWLILTGFGKLENSFWMEKLTLDWHQIRLGLVLDWQKLDHIGFPVGDLLLIEMVPDWPEFARTDNMVSFEGQLTLDWQWIGTCPGLDEIGIES